MVTWMIAVDWSIDWLSFFFGHSFIFSGRADQAKDFFSRLGYPCPPNFNPADHYIHRLAIIPGRETECRERAQQVCEVFAESKRGKNIAEVTQKMAADNELKPVLMKKRSAYKASWIKQFRAVLWRSALGVLREPLIVRVRFFQTIFIALLLGLIYLQQENTAEGAMNINGAIFLFLTNMVHTDQSINRSIDRMIESWLTGFFLRIS